MNLIRGYDYKISTPAKAVVATFKHVCIDVFTQEISLVFQCEGKELNVEVKSFAISSTHYSPRPIYEIKELPNASV
ncbi:MAG: hypothetical protein ACYTXF_33350 [Nostoc sp.]